MRELSFTVDGKMFALVGVAVFLSVYLYFTGKKFLEKGSFKYFGSMFMVSVLAVLGWVGARIHSNFEFNAHVSDYVLAAYNAKTLEESKLQFDRASAYLKRYGMTEGSTALLYPSPEYNVADWFGKVQLVDSSLTRLVALNGENKWKKDLITLQEKFNNQEVDKKDLVCLLDTCKEMDRALDANSPFYRVNFKDKDVKVWQQMLESSDLVKTRMTAQGKEATFNCPTGISVLPNSFAYLMWLLVSSLNVLVNGVGFVYKFANA